MGWKRRRSGSAEERSRLRDAHRDRPRAARRLANAPAIAARERWNRKGLQLRGEHTPAAESGAGIREGSRDPLAVLLMVFVHVLRSVYVSDPEAQIREIPRSS